MRRRNYLQKRGFPVFITMFILSTATICRAEEITLTTYYPSPYGVYSEMRLYPKGSSDCTTDDHIGIMYYDSTPNEEGLKVCGQDDSGGYVWQPISGLWSFSGSNLYPNENGWNVGIGIKIPAIYGGQQSKLDVNGYVAASDVWLKDAGRWASQAVTSISQGPGISLSPNPITTTGTVSLDTASISSCTDSMTNKIYWNGARLACGADQTGGGPGGGNITISAPGGSATGSAFTFDGNVTYSGGNTFTFGGGGVGPGATGKLWQGGNITLSPNPWNPGGGVDATISASGGGAINAVFIEPICEEKNGDDKTCLIGTPGQYSFCALAYHWENTGGGGDDASCRVSRVGNQWQIRAQTGTDANVKCQAVCF